MEEPPSLAAVDVNQERVYSFNDAPQGVNADNTPRNVWIRRFVSAAAVILFVLTIVSSDAAWWLKVFNFHPIFMSLAFMVVLPELLHSVAALRKHTQAMPRRSLKDKHRRIAFVLEAICLAGIIAVQWAKYQHSWTHFATWHACIGGLCEVFLVLELLLGLTIYYGVLDHRLSPTQRTMLLTTHRYLGATVVVTGGMAMFLGMVSRFATRVFEGFLLRLFFAILPNCLAMWAYYGAL